MGSSEGEVPIEKPHAVFVPYPAQGHINPMLQLAKLLYTKGFHITFVNTEYNHRRLLRSRGPSSLDGLKNFRFETIPDGLPPTDTDTTQDIPTLCESTAKTCLAPFRDLLTKLINDSSRADKGEAHAGFLTPLPPPPRPTCIVSDGVMSFTLDAAREFGLPEVLFWTPSACGFNAYLRYEDLIERGLIPFKDSDLLKDFYLERAVEGIPGMEGIRYKDFPSFIRTTNLNDIMLNVILRETRRAPEGYAIILNTFHELEKPFLDAMSPSLPPIYSIGPLSLLCAQHIPTNNPILSIGSNLWKDEPECLAWLDGKTHGSVVYVNFGSITVMTNYQLVEFAWGLANCQHDFLWIIRPDLVCGDSAILPTEFINETKDRGMLASWCTQEKVLEHPAIGGFLTHCGWNSTLESICGGVPTLCWPFFADQQTNCHYMCTEWGIGMEINNNVKRDEVKRLIRELINGSKGEKMKRKTVEWKAKAWEATRRGGASFSAFEKLVNDVLFPPPPAVIKVT